jgi:mannosylglucosylglycerate synthase
MGIGSAAMLGHNAFFCAGQLDPEFNQAPSCPKRILPIPRSSRFSKSVLGAHTRTPETTDQLHDLRRRLKAGIAEFVKRFSIDMLIPQNAVYDPHESAAGHGDDRVHRRNRHSRHRPPPRFLLGTAAVHDQCGAGHPRRLVSAEPAEYQARRHQYTGASRTGSAQRHRRIAHPERVRFRHRTARGRRVRPRPARADRPSPNDILILQPTRLVSRKGVEHAIELVRRH